VTAQVAFDLRGKTAVLATMHGKEAAVGPLLQRFLGLRVIVPDGLDTDRFGTFSREIPRAGSALDAARAKIEEGFARVPGSTIGIASEGSYGPHPDVPYLPLGHEHVLLIERHTGLQLVGRHVGAALHMAAARVTSVGEAIALAERWRFPAQGVLVMRLDGEQPSPRRGIHKELRTLPALQQAVARIVAEDGAAWLETDLRAHRNPPRMRWIRRATLDLVRALRSRCPACERPGFVRSSSVEGLPCASCRQPTSTIKAFVRACASCGHQACEPVGVAWADPALCDLCNP
jgi:hypothetical protein